MVGGFLTETMAQLFGFNWQSNIESEIGSIPPDRSAFFFHICGYAPRLGHLRF